MVMGWTLRREPACRVYPRVAALIRRLRLIRNVGQFDNVSGDATTDFRKVTIIYGENGRGKTTLSAIFRSLANGGPLPIGERHRFGAAYPPQVVISKDGGPDQAIFQNNVWATTMPEIVIFDDRFVDENVFSGLAVEPEHRQHLHDLILGREGVVLNQELQRHVAQIEEHNRQLRQRADPLNALRGTLTVEQYCDLQQRPNIDQEILDAERVLASLSDAAAVREMPPLSAISFSALETAALSELLASGIEGLNENALKNIRTHFHEIGDGAEEWSAVGMQRLARRGDTRCPFCDRDTNGAGLVADFHAYFSDEYSKLTARVTAMIRSISSALGDLALQSVLRTLQQNSERALFWSRLTELQEIAWPSYAETERQWLRAFHAASSVLSTKLENPLDRVSLSVEAREAFEGFDQLRASLVGLAASVSLANEQIAIVKERAEGGNVDAVRSDITRLRVIRSRFREPAVELCLAYQQSLQEKRETEAARDSAREALDRYRQRVFPEYETAINGYLRMFNAGYRVGKLNSANTRGGSACTYALLINNREVPVGSAEREGEPSFRNTLSTGDRTTLALAFFFATLEHHQGLQHAIVVIDDPIASMDSNRTLTTVQEMRRLVMRVSQLVVMSHDKPFLCQIWAGIDRTNGAALEVARDAAGSTIRAWDVTRDSITEHDKRHSMLRAHLRTPNADLRSVAESLRPVLEVFVRAAYPDQFGPGQVLGAFQRAAAQLIGSADAPLSQRDLDELNDLMEYANRFHHNTNPAWAEVVINDQELMHYTERTLRFTRRS
jgi:wobble nucleotide-excising tRNase